MIYKYHHPGMQCVSKDYFHYEQDVHSSVCVLATGYGREPQIAQVVCQSVVELMVSKGPYLGDSSSDDIVKLILSHINNDLHDKYSDDVLDVSGSSLAFAYVNDISHEMISFNLGDHLVLVTGRNKCKVLLQPGVFQGSLSSREAMKNVSFSRNNSHDTQSIVILSEGTIKSVYEGCQLKENVKSQLIDRDYRGLENTLLDTRNEQSFMAFAFEGR